MLFRGCLWIINPLRMGQRISRGAVVAEGDVERLVKIFHKVQERYEKYNRVYRGATLSR
jgi:hypothetical protein